MGTRKYVLCSGTTNAQDLYSLLLSPKDETGFDVKICKLITKVGVCEGSNILKTSGYKIFDFSDDVFTEAWDFLYSASALQMVDPYLRMKLANLPIYDLLYYNSYGSSENSMDDDSMRNCIRNLIVLDADALMYIYYITKVNDFGDHKKSFLNFLKHSYLPYNKSGRNARTRLQISKNKEMVLRLYPSSTIALFANNVFDDDVSFLTAAVSACYRPANVLINILKIKEDNLKLKYETIIRKGIYMNLDSPKVVSFEEAISNFTTLISGRKSLSKAGFDRPLRLTTNIPISACSIKDIEHVSTPNFSVPNGSVFQINDTYALSYANAISNAYSLDYINQAISVQNEFYLLVKNNKYYLCEQKDGIVIGIKNNGKDSLVDIVYNKDGIT